MESKFYDSHVCLETVCWPPSWSEGCVGLGLVLLAGSLLPCKGKTAAGCRGRGGAAGKRWAEHSFHLPAAGPAWARASAPLHYCSLHASAWLGRYLHPAYRFPTYGFSAFFFFCPRLLGITHGCFSKEIFPWQEHDPIDALPARTRHLHRHCSIPTWVQSQDLVFFWENPQFFENEGQNPCGREL